MERLSTHGYRIKVSDTHIHMCARKSLHAKVLDKFYNEKVNDVETLPNKSMNNMKV
jgi:hypothetical protein